MDLATRKMLYYGLLGLLIAGSTIAVFRIMPRGSTCDLLCPDGTLAVYFSSTPSDIQGNQSGSNLPAQAISLASPIRGITPVTVNVTIDSISFHDSGANDSGWHSQLLSPPITINLLEPTSVLVPISKVQIPTENVTMVVMHVSKVVASVSIGGVISISPAANVPSNTLKIPLTSGARVDPQRTTKVVAVRPLVVVAGNSGMINVKPVLKPESISGPE